MMKNTVFLFCLMTLLPLHAVNYDVVPRPQLVTMQQGEPFVLNSSVQILADAGLQQEAGFLQSYLQELTGWLLPVSQKREKKVSYIELALSPKVQGAEGYCLMASQKRVSIAGNTAAGVFYGIQTLRKALADEQQTKGGSVLLPAVTVVDAPRFSYRGMHLDCSRHFFSVDFVKKYIDLLALHNMNVFHWHLQTSGCSVRSARSCHRFSLTSRVASSTFWQPVIVVPWGGTRFSTAVRRML